MTWQQPTNQEISQIINGSKNIAVVGASGNSAKASFFVLTYLVSSANYNLYPINPNEENILGLKVYKSLKEVPVPIDVVVAFRRPDALDELLDEAIELKAKVFWMQLGITNDEVAEKGVQNGLQVVQDRCIKIEHARFNGGLHLAGFDTKVISSKRLK